MAACRIPEQLLLAVLLVATAAASSSFRFNASCPIVRFNSLYNKYEVKLNLLLNISPSEEVALTVSGDAAMKASGMAITGQVVSGNAAEVRILCSSYSRCSRVRDQVISSPRSLAAALRFNYRLLADQAGGVAAALPAAGGLVSDDCGKGWVLFQQRVDASLSFKQNWATYERGFGDISGNYWLGLRNLHSMLIGIDYMPCRLRIEAESFAGPKYNVEFRNFFVYDKAQNYKLVAKVPAKGGNQVQQAIAVMNGMQFSTYDRDNDKGPSSCSTAFGYGGYWYNKCLGFNPNGAYPSRRDPGHPVFTSLGIGHWINMRKIKMMFKCR